jgi:DNA (cytosine-5)-methyltransferase 1
VTRVLGLCAGYGGLELGLRLAVPDARSVCYVEREAACVEVLAARMRDGHLDQAPVWSDLRTLDGRPWRGVVDCITAGIPCQPWSTAGKRKGFDDERHLGEELVRVVDEVGPSLVFVENVRGFIRLGAPDLLGRLADLGFDAEWGVFSSAGVGAPHRRERLFILAYRDGGGRGLNLGVSLLDGERTALGHDLDGRAAGLADAERGGHDRGPEGAEWSPLERAAAERVGRDVADAPGKGPQERRQPGERELQAQGREGLFNRPELTSGQLAEPHSPGPQERLPRREPGLFLAPRPPGPAGDWSEVPSWLHPALPGRNGAKQLNPCFVEWLMGLPPFWSLPHALEEHDQEARPAHEAPEAVQRLRDAVRLHPHQGQGLWARRMCELPEEECHAAAMAERVDRLRMLGNGVDPLVAAHAFRTLATRAGLIE